MDALWFEISIPGKKNLYDPFLWMGFNCLKARTTFNAFQKILDDSARKPNKIWVDKRN